MQGRNRTNQVGRMSGGLDSSQGYLHGTELVAGPYDLGKSPNNQSLASPRYFRFMARPSCGSRG